MGSPSDLFGGNSDGGMRFMEWLDAMCAGCKRESAKARREGEGGGYGCDLTARAFADPYGADMPEWSADVGEYPPHCAQEFSDGNPWPVCLAYEPRKTRSDAGRPRETCGQDALFGVPAEAVSH